MPGDRWERLENAAWAKVGHELDRLFQCISVTTVPCADDASETDSVSVLVEAEDEIAFSIPCEVLAEALRARGYAVTKEGGGDAAT